MPSTLCLCTSDPSIHLHPYPETSFHNNNNKTNTPPPTQKKKKLQKQKTPETQKRRKEKEIEKKKKIFLYMCTTISRYKDSRYRAVCASFLRLTQCDIYSITVGRYIYFAGLAGLLLSTSSAHPPKKRFEIFLLENSFSFRNCNSLFIYFF